MDLSSPKFRARSKAGRKRTRRAEGPAPPKPPAKAKGPAKGPDASAGGGPGGPIVPAAHKTRQRIVAYAGMIFFQRGFRKVTVEELCAGMALSKRTFYKYFRDRDELVSAVVAAKFGEVMPEVIANLNSKKPVGRILEDHFDLLGRRLFATISTPMMVDVQTLMPEIWERIDYFRHEVMRMLVRMLERGQREGSIRADFDPAVLGKIFQTMMTTLAHPAFLTSQGVTMEQLGRALNTLILHGILAPGTEGGRHEK
jgi:TetR/AcrR family transcriptional regulator, cholesterol catabolism regulator